MFITVKFIDAYYIYISDPLINHLIFLERVIVKSIELWIVLLFSFQMKSLIDCNNKNDNKYAVFIKINHYKNNYCDIWLILYYSMPKW